MTSYLFVTHGLNEHSNVYERSTGLSVAKRLDLEKFLLWGGDLVSVAHVREDSHFLRVFFQGIYRDVAGSRKLPVTERCP